MSMRPGPGAVPVATPGSGMQDQVSNLRPNLLGMDLRSQAGWWVWLFHAY